MANETYFVKAGGDGAGTSFAHAYAAINTAVAAAAAAAGDHTIYVYGSDAAYTETYTEEVDFDRSGLAGKVLTILAVKTDLSAATATITRNSSSTTIDANRTVHWNGFCFTSMSTGYPLRTYGTTIWDFTNCKFGSATYAGVGILVNQPNCQLTMTDCVAQATGNGAFLDITSTGFVGSFTRLSLSSDGSGRMIQQESTGATLTFDTCTFTGTGTGQMLYLGATNTATFTRCTATLASTAKFIDSEGTANGFTLTSCTINHGGTGSAIYIHGTANTISATDCILNVTSTGGLCNIQSATSAWTFTRASVTATGAGTFMDIQAPFTSITLTTPTFVCGTDHFFDITAACTGGALVWDGGTCTATAMTTTDIINLPHTNATPLDLVSVRGVTFPGAAYHGLNIGSGVANVIVEDCTLTPADAAGGINIGYDDQTAPAQPAAFVVCRNNTITYGAGGAGHGLLIGEGVTGGEVAYNTTTGGMYGIVCKSDGVNFHHNVAALNATNGIAGVYIRHGDHNVFAHNTIYAPIGKGVYSDDQSTGSTPTGNVFTDNILYAAANNVWYDADGTGGMATFLIDRNVEYCGGATFASINSVAKTTFANWATYIQGGTFGALNERNSVNSDPLFTSIATGDLTLSSASPAKATAARFLNAIGAYGSKSGGGGGRLGLGL